MSCKISKILDLPLIPAADRKIHQRTRRGTGSTGRPITLIVSGVVFGALLGFAQPVRAQTPNSVPEPSKGDVYSALVDFGQVSKTTEPTLVVAAATTRARITKPGPAAVSADDYAKNDPQTCLGCHSGDTHVVAFLKSPMAVKGDKRTPMADGGCESCHGPSAAHVASRMKGGDVFPPIRFKKSDTASVDERNGICLGCHEQTPMLINWQGSDMQRAGVACTDCHTVMAEKDPVLVRKTQPEVCFACHKEQQADSFKYSHHKIREGQVVCSDCHNPMGSAGPHLLKEFTVNETCYNCHADKRGPMLWEHQPVRDDCTNCHTPHGSTEARLLKENMGFICSSCHSASGSNNSGGTFGGGHLAAGRLVGTQATIAELGNNRLCLNCHSQVHGSNSPNGAFFLR
jgi:DmsE family decaheme c-type cytochrome